MSSTKTKSSPSDGQLESPPAKRARNELIEPKFEPIPRHEHYFRSGTGPHSFVHKWIIPNVSYYCLDENTLNQNHVLCSSTFSAPFNDQLRFNLHLYPNGVDESSKNHISLFLKLLNSNSSEQAPVMAVRYSAAIVDFDGLLLKVNGTNKFCAHKDFSNKLAPGDVLTIQCEIFYEGSDPECSFIDPNEIALDKLKFDCARLRLNEELSDVVLVFGDGEEKKEFRAHKAILGARSEVFEAMFDHDMREKKDNRVEVTDLDAEVGECLLRYLYCESSFLETCPDKLLHVAEKYQLHSLKSICEGELCFRINLESVGNLLLLADMHNAALLKSNCIEYIHSQSICVLESESIKGLKDTRPELYFEVFQHVHIPVVGQSPTSWHPPPLTVDPRRLSWSYTVSSVSKCSNLWSIRQFGVNHLSFGKSHKSNYYIESSLFPLSNSRDNSPVHFNPIRPAVQFSVKLYPHGENDDCKDYLSLYLQLNYKDDEKKVAVKVRVSIVANECKKAKGYTFEIKKKLSNGESIGWPKFISREHLVANKELLLNGDKLDLLCEVFYIEKIDDPENVSAENTFAHEHQFSIANDLSALYKSQKLTDAEFSLGRKKFNVHKSIVSARSAEFARLLAHTNQVQIKDVKDVDAFEQMIALVYGQTEGLNEWARKMWPLLDKFKLDSLKQVCLVALSNQLNNANVADFVLLAHKHNARYLKAKAFEYIRRNHSVLVQNETLKVVQQENPELFDEILCNKLENWKNMINKYI